MESLFETEKELNQMKLFSVDFQDSTDTLFNDLDQPQIMFDIQENYDHGMVTHLPVNAQVVMVPSPFIHTILSPAATPFMTPMMSPMMSPMASPFIAPNGYLQPTNLSAMTQFMDPQVNMVSFEDFWEQNETQETEPGTQVEESTLLSVPKDDDGNFSKVPDGKFWKTIKTDKGTVYQCPWKDCGKLFTRPYNLKSHYRGHTGERPYQCDRDECTAAFSRKHDLKRHMKLHEGIRPFQCPVCEKGFARNDALKRHIKPSEGSKDSPCGLQVRTAFLSGNPEFTFSSSQMETAHMLYQLLQR